PCAHAAPSPAERARSHGGLHELAGRARLLARGDPTAILAVGGVRSGDALLRRARSDRDHTRRALQDRLAGAVHHGPRAPDRIRDVGARAVRASVALALRRLAGLARGGAADRAGNGDHLLERDEV